MSTCTTTSLLLTSATHNVEELHHLHTGFDLLVGARCGRTDEQMQNGQGFEMQTPVLLTDTEQAHWHTLSKIRVP